jgi:hypothetical protein
VKGHRLILADQAGIGFEIHTEDRAELTFKASCDHGINLLRLWKRDKRGKRWIRSSLKRGLSLSYFLSNEDLLEISGSRNLFKSGFLCPLLEQYSLFEVQSTKASKELSNPSEA